MSKPYFCSCVPFLRVNRISSYRACLFQWANPGLFYRLFLVFSSKHHYNFYNKNFYPVYGGGIWTHNLWKMSLLPLPPDQGSRPQSCTLFSFFSHDKYSTNLTINDKSVDGMLGSWTWGGRMEGADKSTELWWHPNLKMFYADRTSYFFAAFWRYLWITS